MARVFKVEISFEVFCYEEDEIEAYAEARRVITDEEEGRYPAKTAEITEINALENTPEEWKDTIPWGLVENNPDEKAIRELLAPNAEFRRAE